MFPRYSRVSRSWGSMLVVPFAAGLPLAGALVALEVTTNPGWMRFLPVSVAQNVERAAFGAAALSPPAVRLHTPAAEHVEQTALTSLLAANQHHEAFERAFELGDELFAAQFNALDGGGANVGEGQRFSQIGRAHV
jgi:hypothetical protein